jgi:hypothetical protein
VPFASGRTAMNWRYGRRCRNPEDLFMKMN